MRHLFALVVVLLLGGGSVYAQTPQTQPLITSNPLTYLGPFTFPATDGTCQDGTGPQTGCLSYGSYALGLGPVVNGQPTLYVGGHDWNDQLCQVTIPSIGAAAQMVGRCQTITNLNQIDGPQSNGYVLGGTLYFSNRLLVSAFSYYPGGDSAKNTHFVSGSGLTGLTGAATRVGTIKAGMVAGYMGTIPSAWRTLLGGSALTGNCCTSIIGRSSYGPAVGAFEPDTVGKQNPAPLSQLVNYPDEARALMPYANQEPTNLFNGSTMMGGVLFPSGTRSVLFVGRQGLGRRCYGTGGAQGGECFDPTNSNKGDHAYPYVHQIWAYDAAQLAEVKAGKRQPWEVKPYAIWPFTGLPTSANQSATIRSATYDDTTRRLYIAERGNNTIHVFSVAGATAPPPPPVDCDLSDWSAWQGVTPWSACVSNSQSQQQRRTRTIDVQPANGGKACEATEETQTATQACTVTPPPVTSITVKGTIAIDPIALGPGKYLFVVLTEHGPVTFEFPGLRIPGATRDLKKGDFVEITPSLNPIIK